MPSFPLHACFLFCSCLNALYVSPCSALVTTSTAIHSVCTCHLHEISFDHLRPLSLSPPFSVTPQGPRLHCNSPTNIRTLSALSPQLATTGGAVALPLFWLASAHARHHMSVQCASTCAFCKIFARTLNTWLGPSNTRCAAAGPVTARGCHGGAPASRRRPASQTHLWPQSCRAPRPTL